MKKNLLLFLGGTIAGLVLMGFAGWTLMPRMMLKIHKSKLGFEETAAAIEQSAKEKGWKVPKIYNIQKSLVGAGHKDMTEVKILSLCQADHAYAILKDDSNKKVTAIMPCRLGVYKTQDGSVYISGMNMGLMSKMFGGTIEKVMAEVVKDEAVILKDIIED